MTKTLRMSRDLEAKLKAAARAAGKPQSEIMREGIEVHCANLLSQNGDAGQDHMRDWHEAIAMASEAYDNAPPEVKRRQRELKKRFPDGPARHVKEIVGEIWEEKHARIKAQNAAKKHNAKGAA